jgi:hypothetical protein
MMKKLIILSCAAQASSATGPDVELRLIVPLSRDEAAPTP